MATTLLIPPEQMQATFARILAKHRFSAERAQLCAEIFTQNSVDGVYTHGVNRFPRFVSYIEGGYIHPEAAPVLVHQFGGIEQWDGQFGPGPLNALQATERAQELARQFGIGCVGLAHTNHWMRGGTYGWQAAKEGFIFLGWTNTIANMPAWGAINPGLGNNPFVLALPYQNEAIVLDMAMSQFSFGALELAAMKQETLSVPGGYDSTGQLSHVPTAILESGRSIPIGFWKGAGLSLLLDILASVLSGGASTHEVSKTQVEYGVSQVFIAIDPQGLSNREAIDTTIQAILTDYQASEPIEPERKITYPGERVLATRSLNKERGIPVLEEIWAQVLGYL